MHTHGEFEAMVRSACDFVVMDLGKSNLRSVTACGNEELNAIDIEVVLRARDWDSQLRAFQTFMNTEDNFSGEATISCRLVDATPEIPQSHSVRPAHQCVA